MQLIQEGAFFEALVTAVSRTAADFCHAIVTFPQLGVIFLLSFFLLFIFGPPSDKK